MRIGCVYDIMSNIKIKIKLTQLFLQKKVDGGQVKIWE